MSNNVSIIDLLLIFRTKVRDFVSRGLQRCFPIVIVLGVIAGCAHDPNVTLRDDGKAQEALDNEAHREDCVKT